MNFDPSLWLTLCVAILTVESILALVRAGVPRMHAEINNRRRVAEQRRWVEHRARTR